jgi:hypothetical protein
MTYVTLAGLVVLTMFALLQGLGQLRRRLSQTRTRTFRHGDDSDWECSSQLRVPLRRQ